VKSETIEYLRRRVRAEREAAARAGCAESRWAHEQMAGSYARLVELEELKAAAALAPAKVVALAAALRARDDAEHRRCLSRFRNEPPVVRI
jgi:hypothetical protein